MCCRRSSDAVQSELETGQGEKKALEEQLHEAELAKEAAERHAEEEMATVRRRRMSSSSR